MAIKRTINWYKEAEKISLSRDDWNKLIDTLDKDLQLESQFGYKTVIDYYIRGYWAYDVNKASLFIFQNGKPKIYTWKEKEVNKLSGFEAKKEFVDNMEDGKFQKRYGALPLTLDFFKHSKYQNIEIAEKIHYINRCVGPFIGNAFEGERTIHHSLYKADVSSAYPAQGIENIPTLKESRLVEGMVKPTAEYPVVFYLNSGHIAEYNKFDTHIDQYHYLYKEQRSKRKNITKFKNEDAAYFLTIPTEEELSLCCKYAEKGLVEFIDFYNKKQQGDAAAKEVLNLTIGTLDFHIKKEDKKSMAATGRKYFGHIRAIILARHNHAMINYYNEIKSLGMEFICIQTDSLMWVGNQAIPSATKEKALGNLVLEIENGNGFIHGCGSYFVQDENRKIEKHQGLANMPENIETTEEFKSAITSARVGEWRFDTKTLKHIKLEAKL